MIAVLVATVLNSIQAEPISFDFEVGPASRAAEALGKASGLKMRAEGNVATEVVFVKVDKQPLQNVMASLARVTCADWEKKPDGAYVLSRSQSRVASEVAKSTEGRLAKLTKARASWVDSLKMSYDPKNLRAMVKQRFDVDGKRAGTNGGPEDSKYYLQSRTLERIDPLCRAFARCIRGLDLRPVAGLGYGDTVVFSTDPFPSQRALPATAMDAVRLLQSEQLAWGPALATQPLREGEDREMQFSRDHGIKFFGSEDFPSGHESWERTVPYKMTPAVALLRFTRWYGDRYGITMMLLTSQGKIVLQYSPEEFEGEYFDYRRPEPNPKLPKVEPSAETKALWSRRAGKDKASAIQVLKRFFDDPVNNDPLFMGNQELLSAYSKFRGKSLIACLHDDSRFDLDEELSLTDFLADSGRSISEAGDIIEVGPKDMADHWANRTDRAVVANCIKTLREKGQIDLFMYAKLLASRADVSESFISDFAQCIDPSHEAQMRTFETGHPPYFIQLLASLSSDQLARIGRGETIPYQNLSSAQRAIAWRIVQFGFTNAEHEGQAPSNAAYDEPTLELKHGLLQGVGLKGTVSEDELAVFYNDEAPPWNIFMVENLTHPVRLGFSSGPGPRFPAGGMANAQIGFHKQKYITLKCGLTEGHYMIARMAEPKGPPKSKPVIYKMLSAEDQVKVKKFVERRTGSGRSVPPPR